MSDTEPVSTQVRVDALPAAYQIVLGSLQGTGLKPAELTEIVTHHVLAECLQCGIQVTGADLGQLALTTPAEGEAEDSRIARLRHGYCARRDCEAYYYRLVFRDHPKIDWARITPALMNLRPPPPEPEPAAKPRPTVAALLADKRNLRVLVGLGLLLVLLVVRYFMAGGTLPFIHPPPHYTVDPGSVKEP